MTDKIFQRTLEPFSCNEIDGECPGLWLQRITTREPDDDQLEVALYALCRALNEEVEANPC